jgi:hypothetical protein
MIVSFHQLVDDAISSLMALSGKMQIDHGRELVSILYLFIS